MVFIGNLTVADNASITSISTEMILQHYSRLLACCSAAAGARPVGSDRMRRMSPSDIDLPGYPGTGYPGR